MIIYINKIHKLLQSAESGDSFPEFYRKPQHTDDNTWLFSEVRLSEASPASMATMTRE